MPLTVHIRRRFVSSFDSANPLVSMKSWVRYHSNAIKNSMHTQQRRPPLPPMPRILPRQLKNYHDNPLEAMTGRAPLPPLPRILPGTKTASGKSQDDKASSRLRTAWSNGNILIYLGWTGVLLLLVDRYLQMIQQQSGKQHDLKEDAESAEAMIRTIQEESARIKMNLYRQYKDAPALYRATVIHAYKGMGGSHGLQHVRIGDVVDILQEHVGPDRHYHLCRTTHGYYQQIGWYPVPYLQPMSSERKRRWWWGWWRRDSEEPNPET